MAWFQRPRTRPLEAPRSFSLSASFSRSGAFHSFSAFSAATRGLGFSAALASPPGADMGRTSYFVLLRGRLHDVQTQARAIRTDATNSGMLVTISLHRPTSNEGPEEKRPAAKTRSVQAESSKNVRARCHHT